MVIPPHSAAIQNARLKETTREHRKRQSTKIKRPVNPQLSKKQTKMAIQMQTWLFLMKKKGLLRRNPSAKKVESGAAENYSQGAGLDPYQKTDNMCLTGFQNCCDPVVAMSLLFFPF